jgi:pimeloyl-ACP methyl ester carboxylesterase
VAAPAYDEFACLTEVADELGLGHDRIPAARRRVIDLDGQQVSAIAWGAGRPELVLLHGGGQNAHTWDLVLMLLGRPALAVDLPGHGLSSWRDDHDYGPVANAAAAAKAIEFLAPQAAAVIGMSLGGLTALSLAATRPELVRKLVLVDVSPGSPEAVAAMTAGQRGAVQLAMGPTEFDSQEEMVAAAVAALPRRPASAVRRGVVHNSRRLDNGKWAWRYDRIRPELAMQTGDLWSDVSGLAMPTMLVTGGESGFVTAEHRAEMSRRLPSIRIETVPGAGHAVQSDQPRALAAVIAGFLAEASVQWET